MLIRWKIRQFLFKCRKFGRRLFVLCVILFVIYFTWFMPPCSRLQILDTLGWPRPKFLCISFTGRLGNLMFQYAFAYSLAKDRNLQLIIPKDNMLINSFEKIKSNTPEDYGIGPYICSCFPEHNDDIDCGYDAKFEKLPHTDVSVHGYFQSWKYWINHEKDVRKQLQFNPDIRKVADFQLRSLLNIKDISVKDTILVGVHVRKGDYSNPYFIKWGDQVAPPSYIASAMKYFVSQFSKVFFIVSSDDPDWTSKELPASYDNVYIVRGNTPSVDMALLSMTNHTIMTVGTYGWMVGWLTGGTVVHYRYPYIKGSPFSRQFHKNTSDHFYPGWISME